MFPNRRPVLSARTIKYLYQLGYICSGTACGLATLCLEEQRRRIQVLQKVVDNGKIIRKYLRQSHSVALAANAEDGMDVEGAISEWQPAKRIRRFDTERGIASPSESTPHRVMRVGGVEHSLFAGPDHDHEHQSKENVDRRNPAFRTSEPSATRFQETDIAFGQARRHGRTSSGERRPKHAFDPRRVRERSIALPGRRKKPAKEPEASQLSLPHIRKESRYDVLNGSHDLASRTKTSSKTMQEQAPETEPRSDALIDRALRQAFLTKHAWNQPDGIHPNMSSTATMTNPSNVSSEDIAHDVMLFFGVVGSRRAPQQLKDELLRTGAREILRSRPALQPEVCIQLLKLSLKEGSLRNVRRLCSWLLLRGHMSVKEAQEVCESCWGLANRVNQQDLLQFYVKLLNSEVVAAFGSQRKMELGISVLSSALQWDINVEPTDMCRRLLGDPLPEVDVAESISRRRCESLLASGEASSAARLVTAVANGYSHQIVFAALANDVFDSALQQGQLSACATLLRWKATSLKPLEFRNQLEPFIKACETQGANDLLVDLIFGKTRLQVPLKTLLDVISDEYKGVIAVACSLDAHRYAQYEMIYRSASESTRLYINERSATMSLKAIWKATRNLDVIEAQHSRLLQKLDHVEEDATLRKLDETLLEIYVEANKPYHALQISARINKTQRASSATICLTALIFAKRGAWATVDRVLEIAQKSDSFQFEPESKSTFNKILKAYSEHHSAQESWDYVVRAVRELRFRPTQSTTNILLGCFVADKQLHLIEKWLEYLKDLGQKIEIGSEAATKLLRRYYLKHRPSHVAMMHLARHLVQGSPQFASENLVDLVRQAIGYDLRNFRGHYASWQRHHARVRLGLLDDVTDHIPPPGRRWNEQLYLLGPDGEERLAQSVKQTEHEYSALPSDQSYRPFRASTSEDVPSTSKADGARDARDLAFDAPAQSLPSEGVAPDLNESLTLSNPRYAPRKDNLPGNIAQALLGATMPEIGKWGLPMYQDDDSTLYYVAGEQYQDERTSITRPHDDDRAQKLLDAFYNDEKGQTLEQDLEVDEYSDDILDQGLALREKSTSDSEHLTTIDAFSALRESYTRDVTKGGLHNGILDSQGRKKLAADMMIPFSLGNYRKVVDMYHQTLDATRVPASPMVLEIAVEASLRLHPGDRSQAEAMMTQAKQAGMNVTCAMGPMLLHQMRALNAADKRNIENLRRTVIDYYKMNDENGWHVKHHVGNMAANFLIRYHRPQHGLSILSAIYQSEWAQERPLNITAMSIFLKGYIYIQSVAGIEWVVQTVLAKDMKINRRFMSSLRWPVQGRWSEKMNRLSPEARSRLSELVQMCHLRWRQQVEEAEAFGWELVEQINRLASNPAVDKSNPSNELGLQSVEDEEEELVTAERRADTPVLEDVLLKHEDNVEMKDPEALGLPESRS